MSALPELRDQCIGKWASILIGLGMDPRIFTGKHQPCVFCGGKDRARWVRDKEFYYCNQCGPWSAIDLAINILNMAYRETASEIRKIMGNVKMQDINDLDNIEKNRIRILKTLQRRKPITGNCPVSKYLAKRGLSVLPEKDCYYLESEIYWDKDENGKPIRAGQFPAMTSVIRNIDGEGASLHITYLTEDGKKAPVADQRKKLPKVKPLSGCAIQLFKPDEILGIAEGIETALAVHQLEGIPVWSSMDAAGMASIIVPDNVKYIHIYADSDESFTGLQAASTLAKRLTAEGKEAKIHVLHDGNWLVIGGAKMDFLDYLVLSNFQDKQRLSA